MSDQHLSQIATHWTLLFDAHRGPEDAAQKARKTLMIRYCGAVYRYLARIVRDQGIAEDLTQEFALRFLQGKFSQAAPTAGKFRNYVKTALFHLVQDHYRAVGARSKLVPMADDYQPAAPDENEAAEQAFRESWRSELLARAWNALNDVQRQSGQPFHDVMKLRVDSPDLSSAQLAEALGNKLGRIYTPAGLRQLLHRARERFSELLLQEVELSLQGSGGLDRLEEELADLQLLKYCQDLIDRRKNS